MLHLPLTTTLSRAFFSGGLTGAAEYPLLRRLVLAEPPETAVVIDLAGVEVLSSSYFLHALMPLWSLDETSGGLYFPVLANGRREHVLEEVDNALRLRNVAVLCGNWTHGPIESPGTLGVLDAVGRETLHLVETRGQTTAQELASEREGIGRTGWNNRLSALYEQRLIRRRKQGNGLVYSPAWQE